MRPWTKIMQTIYKRDGSSQFKSNKCIRIRTFSHRISNLKNIIVIQQILFDKGKSL
jgi:hypothetical protein